MDKDDTSIPIVFSKLRVGLLSNFDPALRDSFSGTPHHLLAALRYRGANVTVLHVPPNRTPLLHNIKSLFYKLSRKGRYSYKFTLSSFQSTGLLFTKLLNDKTFDAILCIGLEPVAYINTQIPIFIWHDATYPLLKTGYADYENLAEECDSALINMEAQALSHARCIFYTSNWAASSANREYSVGFDRLCTLDIGANHSSTWTSEMAMKQILSKQFDFCHLLFIASDWRRKGGNTVLRLAAKLTELGIPLRLTLIGAKPEVEPGHLFPPYIKIYGSMPLSDSNCALKMKQLFSEAHFLVLPSKADCAPIGIAEAYSYALPVIATPVGGLPEMVVHLKTGYISKMDSNEEVAAVAVFVKECFENIRLWRELALQASSRSQDFKWNRHANNLLERIVHELKNAE
jgi:glycosyltransferase involved in cell wall biosynthesis